MDKTQTANKLLQHIRTRPAMYFANTEHPFTSLLGFIGGYQVGYEQGKNRHGLPSELVPFDFHKFVTEYFGEKFPAGGKGWSTFISERTKSEKEAFEMFFGLLDHYEAKHGEGG
jgi:hypothetical protein